MLLPFPEEITVASYIRVLAACRIIPCAHAKTPTAVAKPVGGDFR
jgi:hypothetical protein